MLCKKAYGNGITITHYKGGNELVYLVSTDEARYEYVISDPESPRALAFVNYMDNIPTHAQINILNRLSSSNAEVGSAIRAQLGKRAVVVSWYRKCEPATSKS